MGSLLDPALANVLVVHEKELFRLIAKSVLYFRYVVGTLVVFSDEFVGDSFLSAPNSLHLYLAFTRKIKTDGELPFLDILVEKAYSEFLSPYIANRLLPENIHVGIFLAFQNER